MATPYAKNALNAIRSHYKYQVTIMHLTCDEKVRNASEKLRREKGVVSNEDFRNKQDMFFTLLQDYIQCSDEQFFYYRNAMDSVRYVAQITRCKLKVYDEKLLQLVEGIHDLANKAGYWEETLKLIEQP